MRRRRLPAAWLALAVSASACTGGGGSAAEPTDGGSASSSAPADADEPTPGGAIRLGLVTPASLDPIDARPSSPVEMTLADALFDGLTHQPPGADGAEPAIAVSWAATDRNRLWTFRLSDDARFSSGALVTAADVKFTLQRIASRASASLAAVRLDHVEGYEDFVAGSAADLAGIRAVDPTTVEVRLTRSDGSLPELLASPLYGIVPQAVVEGAPEQFVQAPTGSGPFTVDLLTRSGLTISRRNGADSLLDAVELVLFDSLDGAYDAFAEGDVDVALVPPARVDEAAEDFGSDHFAAFQASLFYGFNLAHPAFGSRTFRRAIVKAVDREAVVQAVFRDRADVLGGVLAEGGAGCGDPCAHDPDAVATLLAEEFPGGAVPPVSVDHDDGETEKAVAEAIAAALTEAGIPAEPRALPPAEYDEFAVSGDQQLFRFGWIPVGRSPSATLEPLFRSGSLDNVTAYENEGVDAELNRIARLEDPEARIDAYAALERAILADVPVMPIARFRTHWVVDDDVRALEVGIDGSLTLSAAWLAR